MKIRFQSGGKIWPLRANLALRRVAASGISHALSAVSVPAITITLTPLGDNPISLFPRFKHMRLRSRAAISRRGPGLAHSCLKIVREVRNSREGLILVDRGSRNENDG